MNKFNMPVKDNILYAKRCLADSIWKEANLEGVKIGYPEVLEILANRSVAGIKITDAITVYNLKNSWSYVFETVSQTVDYEYIANINRFVCASLLKRPGVLRDSNVRIGGTTWMPDIPDPESVTTAINEIVSESAGPDRALNMFAYLCRSQLFYDGNKRTAQLIANKMLIADGEGILAIPLDNLKGFYNKLVKFYETGEAEQLKTFLKATAVSKVAIPDPTPIHLSEECQAALAASKEKW